MSEIIQPRTIDDLKELKTGDSIVLDLFRYYDKLNREPKTIHGDEVKQLDSGNYIRKTIDIIDQYDPGSSLYILEENNMQSICSEGDGFPVPTLSFSNFGKKLSKLKFINDNKKNKLKDTDFITFYNNRSSSYISLFVYEILDLAK